jgi:hypothetical protein
MNTDWAFWLTALGMTILFVFGARVAVDVYTNWKWYRRRAKTRRTECPDREEGGMLLTVSPDRKPR